MKLIKLTKNKNAIVDDEDYEYLNAFKWQAHTKPNSFYAHTSINGKRISMHRFIFKSPNGLQIDHINRIGKSRDESCIR